MANNFAKMARDTSPILFYGCATGLAVYQVITNGLIQGEWWSVLGVSAGAYLGALILHAVFAIAESRAPAASIPRHSASSTVTVNGASIAVGKNRQVVVNGEPIPAEEIADGKARTYTKVTDTKKGTKVTHTTVTVTYDNKKNKAN